MYRSMHVSTHVPSAPTPPFSNKKDEDLCLAKDQKSYFEIQLMIYFPERKWDTKTEMGHSCSSNTYIFQISVDEEYAIFNLDFKLLTVVRSIGTMMWPEEYNQTGPSRGGRP